MARFSCLQLTAAMNAWQAVTAAVSHTRSKSYTRSMSPVCQSQYSLVCFRAVDVVCREGPARVLELVQMGADFTRNKDGSLHLTREGGHSNRRIVHAADLTGKEVERALLATARSMPNIHFYEHHLAVELVVDTANGTPHCFGVDVLDQRANQMCRFISLTTMMASGGAGQVYPNTTNPHVATGDGMAMAYRAGATISNMEFVQFHPTALFSGGALEPGAPGKAGRTFLITEAVRGEGGMLYNLSGQYRVWVSTSRIICACLPAVAGDIRLPAGCWQRWQN